MNKFFVLMLISFVYIGCATSNKKKRTSDDKKEVIDQDEPKNYDQSLDLTAHIRRLSGVSVKGNGANASFRIRGVTTLVTSDSPMFLLNGQQFTGSYSTLYSMINVLDIKEIEIVTDISELSFYGSRGANGIIKIDMKKE